MKAEVSPTAAAKGETKPRGISLSTTPSRLRASSSSSSKPKDSETVIGKNGNNGNRVSPPLVPKSSPHSKPIVVLNKPKPKSGVEDHVAVTALGGRFGSRRSSAVVEQFARPRRHQLITPDLNSTNRCSSSRRIELGDDDLGLKKEGKESQEKKNETLIRNLQAEVLELKEDLDKAQRLNAELQSRNRKLSEDLVAAEAKLVFTLTPPPSDPMTPTFKDIQKLIATKLEYSKVKNEAINDPSPTSRAPMVQSALVASADLQKRVAAPHLPPPPPPPPRASVRATITPKAPVIFPSGSRNHDRPMVMSAHSSLVGEIQKRSTHLLAIKTDIETKGEFINSLIQRVLDSAYSNIEDVLQFVDWLDDQLSSLADERAVLKHFKWPEKKADAMREAAVEYRGLKLLESELFSHKDDASIPCGVALKKMAGLLDKSEQSIQRLIKLRTSVMLSYQQLKIPIDWMLDSGFVSKIKQASMMLAKIYLKRVTTELESFQYLERESTQEGLLLQGIHFAYMVHQFAGGLDSETLCAFEAIRRRVPGHLRESRALLAGIPST